MLNNEIEIISQDDPTVLKIFIAEYYFLKKDLQKAFDLFTDIYSDPNLSPIMRETVRNYLVIANRELRKKEIDGIDFEITVDYKGRGTVIFGKESFSKHIAEVGTLLEILDYYLRQEAEKQKDG
jgi:hypothetical protein